ncbi:COMM domain-containing protein, putative [Entamoeba dispar SAW760]|uniref:COMM domain-containing protein, putative n=1 Tax=Entamoeba dispar (strain ATCC PRA-260 / SAW760) TaxID=370354 RepID=B0ELQ0_ENTDS|nr:COMM domain-containing protein, putative [Entamoeba dispar SAW760]EDR24550.1 COMM domain-containing protein, putative [Entamoeba dispar SAW760]|eukprot:EDR24550.1 COMM domain-containing protein, putative [Entamoeba dispar SAW760]
MKFQFCGGLNVPDWLLKEIGTVQRLNNEEVKEISIEIINNMIKKEGFNKKEFNSICERRKLTESDLRGIITTLRFILCSAAQYDISSERLLEEELEIGIDIEIAETISKIYEEYKEHLQRILIQKTIKLPHIQNIQEIEYNIIKKDEITNENIKPYIIIHIITQINSFDLIIQENQIKEMILSIKTAIKIMKKGLNNN